MKIKRIFFLLATLSLLGGTQPAGVVKAGPFSQTPDPVVKAKALLQTMTAEERVGQLFLVTFKGTDVSRNSQIYDLVVNHHIGGVVLSSANNNFSSAESTVLDAFRMNTALQRAAWDAYQEPGRAPDKQAGGAFHYTPLFIGVSHEGDQIPYDQIINGMTPLPNLMAIGATWSPEQSKLVGNVLGNELRTLGFNLLVGPSLDVLETIPAEDGEDLGTRSFGGDPYWVGVLGSAYIDGLHTGSENRLMVVAKHFPGRGGSDRPPEEEVATVRKSLEQLKQIELAPFFNVTGNADNREQQTDGLLVSHIRYQGLQGNIRATTRPVSFDSQALTQMMSLPAFSAWREMGGVLVSDDLGSQAVKKFFDPSNVGFDARQVARNAFLAGNDLLYVNNLVTSGDQDAYTTMVHTLELFKQKYNEDPAFSQRVDASVTRLLALKFRMYLSFSPVSILPDETGLAEIGQSSDVSFQVAKLGATLLSPSQEELRAIMPRPPEINERMVFITDVLSTQQCGKCPAQSTLPIDGFQKTVLRFFGPQAGGQVTASRMASFSFTDLINTLNNIPEGAELETSLRQADWIVFSMLNIEKGRPASLALRRFLRDRPDLFRNKKVLAFSFNAPYYLDSTDISKLTAYFAMFSKVPSFVDVAARLLFQEMQASGGLPVSVSGVGYDLIQATSPNPEQIIPLELDQEEIRVPQKTGTPQPTAVPTFKVGDSLPLKAGVIVDNNNRQVPDGTVVRFLFNLGGEKGTVQQIETTTSKGIAKAAFKIQTPGLLEVRVVSDPAVSSQLLRLDISNEGGAMITAIAPSPIPTHTLIPTFGGITTSTPIAVPESTTPGTSPLAVWFVSMILLGGLGFGTYLFESERKSIRWGIRFGFLVVIGGLLAYLIVSIKFIPALTAARASGSIVFIEGVLIGAIIGWIAGSIWYQRGISANTKPGGEPTPKV